MKNIGILVTSWLLAVLLLYVPVGAQEADPNPNWWMDIGVSTPNHPEDPNPNWWLNIPSGPQGQPQGQQDIAPQQAVGANIPNPIIRVGLVSGQGPSIAFEDASLVVGFYRDGGFTTEAVIETGVGFVVQRALGEHVLVSEGIHSRAEAVLGAQALEGHTAVPVVLAPGEWGVLVVGVQDAHGVASSLGGRVLPQSGEAVAVSEGGITTMVLANDAHLRGAQGTTEVNSGRYRGAIEPRVMQGGGGVVAVNLVHLEDYLLSVVPSEMPPSWPLHALKAQAVAARTYALSTIQSSENPVFQLVDTVMSQVYRGVSVETQSTTQAVQDTAGIRMTFEGRYINATYFSSSGGRTEDSENVWQNTVPYLRSVAEGYETGYMLWSRSLSLSQLTGMLSGHGIGEVTGIRYTTAYPSGRVVELEFLGTAGQRTYSGDSIRNAFQNAPGGSLESNNFSINGGGSGTTTQPQEEDYVYIRNIAGVMVPIPKHYIEGLFGSENLIGEARTSQRQEAPPPGQTRTITSTNIEISGRGWGHGVGMSQFGARGMAEAGYSFEDILRHYYTGIEVGL